MTCSDYTVVHNTSTPHSIRVLRFKQWRPGEKGQLRQTYWGKKMSPKSAKNG
jgi:hypothetical protein